MRTDRLKIIILLCSLALVLPFLCLTAEGKDFTVVIDPGHGGHDPGAIGRRGKEKNINLNVALKVGRLIQNNCKDVKVIFTRRSDVFIPLDRRAQIANNAKADLFISIHTNSVARGRNVRGTETYTLGLHRTEENLEVAKKENSVILIEDNYQQRYAGFNPNSSESYIIFEFLQDKNMEKSVKLATLIQKQFKTSARRIDKGVHQAGFLVLRETSMPSVLIELGYISTHDEEAFLNSQNGIRKMSQSIYNAFLSYKRQHTKGKTTGAEKDVLQAESDETQAVEGAVTDTPESDIGVLTQNSDKPSTSEPEEKKQEQPATDSRPVFKIQIQASTRQIPAGSSRFKNLSPIDFYKEGAYYKYTYGATTDYQEAIKIRNKIKEDFEGAFIVAFKNGQKMELSEAISEYKKNK